jgi:hypothetical protein
MLTGPEAQRGHLHWHRAPTSSVDGSARHLVHQSRFRAEHGAAELLRGSRTNSMTDRHETEANAPICRLEEASATDFTQKSCVSVNLVAGLAEPAPRATNPGTQWSHPRELPDGARPDRARGRWRGG